jgi:predicted dehydrogenase
MFNVALIGCGFMGSMHSEVYRRLPSARICSALDKSPSAAWKISDAHQGQVAQTFEEILGDPQIDVVDICLPTHLHAEFAILALTAGKHVFCEKPMALNVRDAERMVEAAQTAGRYLMIGHCIRFWPEYAILKSICDDGRLGALHSLTLTRLSPFPSWSSEGWIGQESLSGGAALDLHIHDTDFALYLLGKPDEVRSACTIDHRGPSHIFTAMTFGATIVQLEGGWDLPADVPFKMAFRATFERGAAVMDGGPLTIYQDGKGPEIPEIKQMSASAAGGNLSDLGGYYLELLHFYGALAAGRPLEIAPPKSSLESLRQCLAEIELAKRSQLAGVAV